MRAAHAKRFSCIAGFSPGAVCQSSTSAAPCSWAVLCHKDNMSLLPVVPAHPTCEERVVQSSREEEDPCFPPEGYPVSPVLYFLFLFIFLGLAGAADCLLSSLLGKIHRPTHCHCSVPFCLQQSHSHFQLSWLKIKTKHTQSLWRRLVPCYQCFRYLPLEPCTAIFTGRALLSGTAVSTEKLLAGKGK